MGVGTYESSHIHQISVNQAIFLFDPEGPVVFRALAAGVPVSADALVGLAEPGSDVTTL